MAVTIYVFVSGSLPEAKVLRVRHPHVDRRAQERRGRHLQGRTRSSPIKGTPGSQGLDVKSSLGVHQSIMLICDL